METIELLDKKRYLRGSLKKKLQHFQLRLGYPIDQTTQNGAMAQIQIVARKKNQNHNKHSMPIRCGLGHFDVSVVSWTV